MQTFTRLILTGALALAWTSQSLGAQSAPPSSTSRAFAGALAGAAAGALAGGIIGAYIGGNRCVDQGNPDSCYLIAGTAVGFTLGVTAGVPIGAHLFNRRRGDLGLGLLASAALGAAGTLAFFAIEGTEPGRGRTAAFNTIIIRIPLLQVISSGLIESRTGR